MARQSWWFATVAMFVAFGCSAPTAADCVGFTPTSPDMICVTGAAHYYALEGGFWAVRGDDDTTYDPLGALPTEFRHDGLRVRLEARIRSDVVSFHMAGPIVEILDIRRL
jgi:hypothetical protein